MMRVLATISVILFLAISMATPFAVAADDQSANRDEYLTDADKTYIAKLEGAYAAAGAALDKLDGEMNSAVAGALFGAAPSATEMVMHVSACAGTLAAQAPAFREAPPDSLAGLASTNAAIAARLTATFGPTMAIIVEEGKRQALQAARERFGGFVAGLLGGETPSSTDSTIVKARFVASVSTEITALKNVLAAGRGELAAAVAGVVEDAKAGSEFLDFLFDECFIATAAYGTKTAAEIDVLRDFRDGVLMRSPAGRDYVGFYYAASPPVADFIREHETLRTLVREGLIDPIVCVVSLAEPLWRDG